MVICGFLLNDWDTACRILGMDCCCYDGAGVSTGWIVTVATSRGWISIFKCRFHDTVAADEVIRLVVKKKELAERQESNLPDTDGL